MRLQFLKSLGFIPVHLADLKPEIQIITVIQAAKDFSGKGEDEIISGICRHKEKQNILILLSQKPGGTEVILAVIKNNALSQGVILLIGKIDDDIELQESIIKLFVAKHVQ